MDEENVSEQRYEWKVATVPPNELEKNLNSLDSHWDVFSIVPVLQFGKQVMGTPVPSGVSFHIIMRRSKG